MYELKFTPAATRDWRKLPLSIQQQIAPHLDQLSSEPRPHGVKKLKGFQNIYRVRSGDYRIIYEIENSSKIIWITKIMGRKDEY
ncbi:MAG TPA: type II toxin-antitoxin system RelE/ParE family toxin [Candidatus Kapabacteria bacterium]|nr:type II toxin-antitoxin system RelE/ParE family toxin [Candidatus Kapabacteria bacterium]